MSEFHFPIPGHEDDKIVIFTRRHIVSMLGTVCIIAIMFLVPIIILMAIFFTDRSILSGVLLNFLVIGGSIYYLVTITFAFIEWISYYYDIFIVTENEIIDVNQSGIFDRNINEITLLRVQDVSARIKGVLPTIFKYGDVVAESAGENTRTYVIDNIPNPVEIANKILAMHNEHVAREERGGEEAMGEGDLRAHKRETPKEIVSEFKQAIQKEIEQNQGKPQVVQEPCPPPPPPPETPLPIPPAPPAQGQVKIEDEDQGGEVKF